MEFNIPPSHKKNYTMLREASTPLSLPRQCTIDLSKYCLFQWPDGLPLLRTIKAKAIYPILADSNDIFAHVNSRWNLDLDDTRWHKLFVSIWGRAIEPKKGHFCWLLTLHKLPILDINGIGSYCSYCRVLKSINHIFFECLFAKEIWNIFGINISNNVGILDVVTGHIQGLRKLAIFFWSILLAEVLQLILKYRNDKLFNGRDMNFIESLRRLIFYDVNVQVIVAMRIS